MIDAIIIRFATAGIPEVSAAFARVETQAKKFEQSMTNTSEKGGRTRVSAADKEAREKIKAYQKVDKEVEKAQRAATRELEREEKRRADIVRRSSEMAGRDAVKAAREEARAIERLEKEKLRAKIKAQEEAARAAARAAAEEIRANERVASRAGRYAQKWGGRLGGAASMIGMTAGIGGAFMLADAGRKEFSDEKNAAQLVNLVTAGGKAPPEGANVKNILAQAGAVARDTGVDRADIVEASKTYAKNAKGGDFKGVMGNMGIFAKLAKVTGADINQIAEAAGTLQSQNPDINPAMMQQILLNANEMSKQGTMSFADSLQQMGKVGSTRSSYAGNMANNQQTLIGLAQLAKSGGTPEEVGTFTSALAMESTEANKKFKKKTGRELFKTDQFGRIESPETLITDILRNTGGNIQTINSLMGRRGGELFRELEGSYIKGAGPKNNVEAGIAEVQKTVRSVTGARGDEASLNAQFEQSMSTPAEKFGKAMNTIQEELEEKLAPALEKFADKLSSPEVQKDVDGLINGLGQLASFLIDLGPYKGIAAIIGARVAGDIANAAIGEGVKRVMERTLASSLSDKMLSGLNIATATLVVASLLTPSGSKETGGTVSAADKDAADIASGKVSPKDVAVQADRAALLKRKAELQNEVDHPSGPLGETVARGARALVNPVANFFGLDIFEKQLKTVTDSLERLDNASKKAAGSVQGIPPVSTGAPTAPIGSPARS